MRPFREEMQILAESRQTEAEIRARLWIAADMTLDASGDFLTGVLGFADAEDFRDLDRQSFSWIKGEVQRAHGASRSTMVPFAVDLRDDHRWVAFATSHRIRQNNFSQGLGIILTSAVKRLRLIPAEWEVDLVTSFTTVEEWLEEHPDVYELVRIVRFPNPRRDIDEDRKKMKALGASRKAESYSSGRDNRLELEGNPVFEHLSEGLDTGDVAIILKARGPAGSKPTFKSWESADEAHIEDFGDDYQLGMERILDVLRRYVEERGKGQGDETP